MLVAKLSGGLGNQMFQYAAAIAVARKINCNCKIDLGWFEENSLHNGFELADIFELGIEVSNNIDKKKALGFSWIIFEILGSKVLSPKISFILKYLSLKEESFDSFIKEKFIKKTNVYMVGYWQSEEYFLESSNIIRSIFNFDVEHDFFTQRYKDEILNSSQSVSLHIRRGDYVSDKKSNDLLGTCSVEYYKNAIKTIETTLTEQPSYFIFSDDLAWAKDQFFFLENVVFVSGNEGRKSFLDMYLMSLCKHHVIANSSFSWWGAWLSNTPNQIVCAPSPWFDINQSIKKIYPPHWILFEKNPKVRSND